jgi:hypothetical protein
MRLSSDAAGIAGAETVSTSVGTRGFVAIRVTANGLAAAATYDLTWDVQPARYSVTSGTAAFTDICPETHPDHDPGNLTPADRDEGETALIDLPTGFGFEFFENPVTQLIAGANGWILFGAGPGPGTSFSNEEMPNAGGDLDNYIAPYWADLYNIRMCSTTSGTKYTVQWSGTLFEDESVNIQMQAVLDSSDDSIELIYGPNHEGTGANVDGATIGAELDGTEAVVIQYNQTGITAGTSRKLTPM